MATYTITLPNPVPKITDALAYDHGNILVVFTVREAVQEIELSTELRANTALNKGRNAWVIVSTYGVERYRYYYATATRIITIISVEPLEGSLEVYILGRESDWDGEDLLTPVVTKNISGTPVALKRTNRIGPSTDPTVRAPWPNATFDSVDVDVFYDFGIDLPVWTVRPNWKGGVLERLEWLTDVLASSTGAEQRRSLRPSPRRSIEITINPTQNERTFVDLLLHRLGSNEWLFPLWFDKARLSVAAELGADRIDFDNTYREFTDGGLALIYKDAFTYEVISIAGQDDTGLDLDIPLAAAWGKNVAVYPLRRARLQNETELRALSSRVGESVLLWTITEANDYPEEMPDAQSFEGMPVITVAPNRSQDITVSHTRLAVDRDNQVGIPYRVDQAGRAFQVQSHSWMLVGRQAQSEFRSMLYWLRGRQRAVWLPSFNEDIVTSRASALASTNLDIQKIGITYAGGVIPGRDVVRVNGTPGRITALGAPQSPQEERLRIGAGLTAAVPAGRRGSFMSPARLNQDGIEILHHADTNGAAECSTTFKTFSNTRDAGGTIYKPIPAAIKLPFPCGSDGGVFNLDANSFTSTMQNSGGIILVANPAHYLVVVKPSVATSDGVLLWDAFSLWPMDVGSPLPPPVEGQTWDNRFRVYGSNGGGETLLYDSRTNPVSPLSSNLYTTPAAAFAAIQLHLPLVRTGYSQYRITVFADSNLGDNRAGMSLLAYITPTAP